MSLFKEEEWQLIWSDDFQKEIDNSIWTKEVIYPSNSEQAYYVDDPRCSYIENSCLVIKSIKEKCKDLPYISARLNTRNKKWFTYGRIEAKIKMPNIKGSWPAFWMLGQAENSMGWPRCGEIDIMEHINYNRNINNAVHYNKWSPSIFRQVTSRALMSGNLDVTKFHIYGCIWSETEIKFYVDDNILYIVKIVDEMKDCFNRPAYLLLNMAVGGTFPKFIPDTEDMPLKMDIDWVKVYSNKLGDKIRNDWYVDCDNNKYYMDSNGEPLKKLQPVGEEGWFYFDDISGRMKKGFISYNNEILYFNSEGKLTTKWNYINGNWYYFNPNPFYITKNTNYEYGQMLINETVDGLTIDNYGKWNK